ncbi:M50 family metallopeptidase [Candidatus Poriferisodalis sp.]|uniref:M50 family metallopeptidase n=1 Tax=Candidatus Poriferisodalis sp. TaxID=3101277 RepID=UPI003B02484E
MKGYSSDEHPSETGGHATARSPAMHRLGRTAALVALGYLAWQWPLAVGAAAVLAGVLFMHELGHFVTARAVGMKATDFFLGFGPRLWSFRRGETTYGLRALPLGAYVRIIGMSRADLVDPADESRAFRVKSYPRRALVVCAGSLMHLLLALVAFGALHAVFGAPVLDEDRWQVAEVVTTTGGVVTPASAADIEVGDRIVAVNDADTRDWESFMAQVQSRPGEQVQLDIQRDGSILTAQVALMAHPQTGSGFLGVRASQAVDYQTVGLPVAMIRAVRDLGQSIADSVYGIWALFSNIGDIVDRIVSPPGDPSASSDLATRPVSVVGIVHLASHASLGWSERVLMFALVNVFLGVFNMLPVPPFDGGHLAVATYERWRERAGRERYMTDPKALAPVVAVAVTALVLLAAGLLYLDIANPIDL